MSSRFVRSSKYRHVFGTAAKKELIFDGIKPSKSAWDSNKVTANTKYIGVIWDAGGGGAFCVLNQNKPGKLGPNLPLIVGHSADVLDIDFNPFNESLIASASEDGYAKIWQIPEGGLTANVSTPVQSLSGHKRKVGTVNFSPVANNVLATSSTDFSVKIWDIEAGDAKIDVSGHSDIIQSLAWNYDGTLIATAAKDRKVRSVDPRSNHIVAEVEAHAGVKGMRVLWLGKSNRLFTTGFSKTSERQYSLWEPRNFSKALTTVNIDTASGIIMPFYDNDTQVLFLAGKGDGNIRYYELVDEDPYLYFLSEYKSSTPQRGMGAIPKLGVDVSTCEIAKLLKLGATSVEPISFQVPRKSDIFQDDLYPDTFGTDPALSANEWFSGKTATPKLVSLAPGFVAPSKPAAEFKPVVKEEEGPKNETELRAEYEKLKKRVAYLEAEIVKKDAKIKELGGN
jgi:coronin-1B/1C/6